MANNNHLVQRNQLMDLKQLIAREATDINRVMHEDIDQISTMLDPLLAEILNYGLFGGGKRVRPLLTVLSARLSGANDPEIYRLASAFEYVHVASLFHDDVIDGAGMRRGNVSVNKKYGTVGAILAGDFLLAHSMDIVGRYVGSDGLEIFTEATRGMVDGEFVQLRNGENFNQSQEDYFKVVMGKTALLIGAACEIGAKFGRADQKQQTALRTYGINLGYAFQIIDDLLDYLGDEKETGKAVGNDLKEGKMTLPLIIALDNAPKQESSRLLDLLKRDAGSPETLDEVVSLINDYDGFTASRIKAEKIIEDALEPLSLFNGDEHSRSIGILKGLSQYVLTRNK